MINDLIGMPLKLAHGRWSVDRPDLRWIRRRLHEYHLTVRECKEKEQPSTTMRPTAPRWSVWRAAQSKLERDHMHIQTNVAAELIQTSKQRHKEQNIDVMQ